MSSVYVRETIINFITTEIPSEDLVDMTADYEQLQDFLRYYDIEDGANWIGIQFVGSDEIPVSLSANNLVGGYTETGVFYIHVVAVAKLGGHNAILSRAEAIRDKFRGQRIGPSILIEAVTPPNFGAGISLDFEGGYTSATILIDYKYQKNI